MTGSDVRAKTQVDENASRVLFGWDGADADQWSSERAVAERVLTTTRSVRRRLDLGAPVPLTMIDDCLEIALQAPNTSGREAWRWIVVTSPQTRAQLGEIYAACSEEYLSGLREADPDLDEESPALVSSRTLWRHLGDVPIHVVACVQLEPWHRSTSHRTYAESCIWGAILPAVWSFQLACRTRGLGTCFVTGLLKREADVRATLGVPDEVLVAGVVAVARTSGTFRSARRLPLSEVRRYERWS